ncbi:coproporphyrinogen III oxidase [Aurantiacibacter atlanticus]|uniref:Heme chaperone HemW n=1 Tax=Aurantiacibacter atlanticus TaxID=1648404 RepID=A0A0H4VGT2_9SPHN|nr:radical SAM family heme chaperone HemW [Aurantiacibacter atlanticus]AKQ42274.1 coproporphyrinogen III oxidase [Aurantiacibacter atlanticus]MDF1835415.1 radical SAM family heme chaperone HemW [Alteraurantiacibacter sp. bin_em_oilr2.035]
MARALYIHWPFCLAKCPYCDFNSHVRQSVDIDLWQQALLADLRHEAALAGGEALESIFFGGGTPSLMPPQLVNTLLQEAEKQWGFSKDIEITLEANPSSVEAANFASLADAGVNRVSLGLQSLDDEALRFLGRLHGVEEGLKALETAQSAYNRVSFDLIYALPGQTATAWENQLRRALDFGTGHLSLYQLTIEPGTRFATMVRQHDFTPLDDDEAADLIDVTRELTKQTGLPAYEISNHARPGEESRHNLTYWRYQDYAGIGPGAHGRRGGLATTRHKKPENFLSAVKRNGSGLQQEIALGMREQASEALLMGLRLAEGIDLSSISARFNLPEAALVDLGEIERHAALGLVRREANRLFITDTGMPLLDALLPRLVADDLVTA